MCRTTGAGIATKRAFSGVMPPPFVLVCTNPDRRTTPATTGTKLSISSALSSFQR
jgi:hypothetical protein